MKMRVFVLLLAYFLRVFCREIPKTSKNMLKVSIQGSTSDTNGFCDEVKKVSSQKDMMDGLYGQYDSIGYLSLDKVSHLSRPDPGSCGIQVASMQNKKGNIISADTNSIQSSVLVGASTCPDLGICFDILDSSASNAWPMSFLSYVMIQVDVKDSCQSSATFSPMCTKCLAQKTTYDYIMWILRSTTASNIINSMSFGSLPRYLVQRIEAEILPFMVCAGLDGVKTRAADWPADVQSFSLVGGGSSVQSEVQAALANAFNVETSVSISFPNASSRTSQLLQGLIHFEQRDNPPSNDPTLYSTVRIIPVMAAAVVPVFNFEKYQPLVLSRAALSDLFLGSITSWKDSAIVTLNPSALLMAHVPIRYVVSDDSEATGVPSVFYTAIHVFAGLQASPITDPIPSPSQQTWPVASRPQTTSPQAPLCRNRACAKLTCPQGSYYDSDINGCRLCSSGYFAVSPGALTCQACPPGKYSNLPGAVSCSKCGEKAYQSASGATGCLACPENTRRYGVRPLTSVITLLANKSLTAALDISVIGDEDVALVEAFGTDIAECLCLEGFWLPSSVNNSAASGKKCNSCPEGATCKGFSKGRQNIPTTKMNYWGDPAYPEVFFECEVGHCLENYQCAPGRGGRFCSQPLQGYYIAAGTLKKCEGDGMVDWLILLTVLEMIGWIMCVNLACSQYHSLSVDMIMLQTSGYIAKLKLRWHPDLEIIPSVAAFFNFEISYIGHQCGRSRDGWSDSVLFYWQLAFPFLAVAVCSIWWLFKMGFTSLLRNDLVLSVLRQRQRVKLVRVIKNKATLSSLWHTPRRLPDYLLIKLLQFFVTGYPVLVYTAFSVFICQKDGNGQQYLINMPETICWSPSHWNMVFFAIAYIPVVLISIPLILGRRLYWGLKADLLHRCSFMESYGWLYARYKCEYAWWEVVVLLRRGLIAIVAAFSSVPMVSASMILIILNVFVAVQLQFAPQVQRRIRLLEVGSLFCCTVQAVSGVLLCPSLDKSPQCVGSTMLDRLGPVCGSNSRYKAGVTAIVLAIFSANLLASVLLFISHIRRNMITAAAVRRVHREYDLPYDEYDIHLANMLDGPRLSAMLENSDFKDKTIKDAFCRLHATLPGFVLFNHIKSSHFAQNPYAKTLNKLLVSFPGLIDWIAHADRSLVTKLEHFIADFATFAAEHHREELGCLIVPEYQPSVLMWLATCSPEQRLAMARLLLEMAAAGGITYHLRPGDIRLSALELAKKNLPVWTDVEGPKLQSEIVITAAVADGGKNIQA